MGDLADWRRFVEGCGDFLFVFFWLYAENVLSLHQILQNQTL